MAACGCTAVCVVGPLCVHFGWAGWVVGAWLSRPCQSACLLISKSATHQKRKKKRQVCLLCSVLVRISCNEWERYIHTYVCMLIHTNMSGEREVHVNSACTVSFGAAGFLHCEKSSLRQQMCVSVCECVCEGIYDCAVNMPVCVHVSAAAIAKAGDPSALARMCRLLCAYTFLVSLYAYIYTYIHICMCVYMNDARAIMLL